ncbi:MAG: hypothetical protein U1F43_01055 [Myxococcota bacterium]
MPFDMKTKKVLDESKQAKDTAKANESTKKPKVVAGADVKAQEDSLKPKEAAPKKSDATKKESSDAKTAKKDAAKKAPPEPDQVAEKVAEKDDSNNDYWAVREVVGASHNAAKLDESKLKEWIKTAENLLAKADFTMAVDLRASIERFQEAIEALKQPKGLAAAVVKGFLKSVEAAPQMKADGVKALVAEGERLLKGASKTQAQQIQDGLDRLYKTSGGNNAE